MSLADKVLQECVDHGLLPPGSRVAVALSGGGDSVALLFLLRELAEKRDLFLSAVHVEHGLRGESSLGDMAFCVRLCGRLGIPLVCCRADVPHRRLPGENLEGAARRLRYQVYDSLPADYVALGHHMDDAAETFLLHLLRGSGREGLLPMARERGRIVRPLLGCTRQELQDYLRALGETWQEDETNTDESYSRNYIRATLLPAMAKLHPQPARAIASASHLLAEEEQALGAMVEQAYESLVRKEEEGISLSIPGLGALPPALALRVLRRGVEEVGSLTDVTRAHMQALYQLTGKGTGKILALPGRFFAQVSYNALILRANADTIDKTDPVPFGYGSIALWGGWQGEARVCPAPAVFPPKEAEEQFLAAGALCGAVFRTRQPGDTFRPFGMEGRTLLKEWMIDHKIPRDKRDRLPLLAAGSTILLIPGYGVSEECRVEQGSEMCTALRLTTHREN